ncbi:MAG: HAD family phosphatase [Bacteroidetes bacterium]|nr:HAD family phosphatase [Bacteroidota bacterium]
MTPAIVQPKAVIFDFGGVLLDLDLPAMTLAFEALGVTSVEALFSLHRYSPAFIDLEIGAIDPATFATALRRQTGLSFDDESLFQAWNALLGGYRLRSLSFVEQLGAAMPVYLYSNTNLIHYRRFQQEIREATPYPHLDVLFRKAYYSHEMGMRKPHPEGYQHILQENGLKPQTTLFVDDNADNIAGAAAVGLQTHHLQSTEIIEDALAWLLAGQDVI